MLLMASRMLGEVEKKMAINAKLICLLHLVTIFEIIAYGFVTKSFVKFFNGNRASSESSGHPIVSSALLLTFFLCMSTDFSRS